MKFVSKERFLEIYAGVLTAVFAVTVFAGFADSKKTPFDECELRRTKIVEEFEAKKRIDALPAEQRQGEWKKFMETHPGDANRIVLGRATDTSAVLKMRDTKGHDRLIIKVAADGSPTIQFLDEGGKVLS